MGCVYCATNTINGKQYVGQTIHTMEYRRKWHKSVVKLGSQSPFHVALRKCGESAFRWSVLVDGISTKSKLESTETAEIRDRQTLYPKGYNLTIGGSSHVKSFMGRCRSRLKLRK